MPSKDVEIIVYDDEVKWKKKELKDRIVYYFYIEGFFGLRPLLKVRIPKNHEVKRA